MTASVIQGTKGRNTGVGSIASTAITTSAGSALIAAGIWDTGTFSSLVDSKSNTWTQIGAELTGLGGGSNRARIYYSELDAAKVGASHTVTLAQTGTSAMTLVVIEVGGGTIPGVFDKQAGKTDNATPFASGPTVTTTQAIELIVSALFGTSGSNPASHALAASSTPTSGWAVTSAAEETNGVSFYTGALANVRVTSTGAYEGSWTETGGADSAVWTATFKEATAVTADGRDLSIPSRPGGSMGPRMRRAFPQQYPDSPVTPVELTQTPAAPIPAIALGPRRRRSIPQQYADTPAIPVELTQSPAAPFRPGRGPGMGPMSLRRNIVWPSADGTVSPNVTVALSGVEGTGAVGTLGVQHDQALTGNEATGAVGTLTPGTSVALTGLAATGSVGTLAPSTDVAMTGVAGTVSVGTLAPSTTVTLTGNEATVTIGTLAPSVSGADVTVALTGVSATALIGDLSPSGADVAVVVQPVTVGGGGVASRPIQDKYWREIEQRYKKKKKQAEKKSKIAVEIIEDIARRGDDLEDALQELKAELAEEHIRQSKVYVELLKLKLELAEADEEEEEAVTLLASEDFRL